MVDPRDLVAQNHGKGAETEVDLPDGSKLIGLRILGVDGYPMLGIRLDELHRPISFATADSACYARVPMQMNPRRIIQSGEDA